MVLKSGITRSDLLTSRTFHQPFFGPTESCGAFQGFDKLLCNSGRGGYSLDDWVDDDDIVNQDREHSK